MAEQHRRAIEEARRLAHLVKQERAEAIRQQLAAANTFLELGDTELKQGRVHQANALLKRMQGVAKRVRSHLNEPNHVPLTEAEVQALLESCYE